MSKKKPDTMLGYPIDRTDALPPPDIRILSVRQPWAWLIVETHKGIENRTWTTHYRGPLLIHVGKTRDKLAEQGFRDQGYPLPQDLNYGGIVGIVDLVDIITEPPVENYWYTGPYGWVLANAQRLPFYPMRGKLGIFAVERSDRILLSGEARDAFMERLRRGEQKE